MINVIGQIFGTSGYANHTRGLVNELNKLTPCKLITNVHQGFERQVNDAELEMIKRVQDFDINLVVTHPINWKSHLDAKRNWVYLIWEGDRVPLWIMKECFNDRIEKIICPSGHTKKALIETLTDNAFHTADEVMDKVVVIPHGVDTDKFYPLTQQPEVKACQGGGEDTKESTGSLEHVEGGTTTEYPPAEKFQFLMNKGFRNLEDRGGVQYGIKAYLEEFDGHDTELIVKINPAYGIPNLIELIPELEHRDDVKFITADYSTEQLNEMYNNCDVFISPTRAEAFNLPCLEALSCGKPVITTNYGGQTDFINNETGWLVDYDLVDVKHELEYEGIEWAIPKHEGLKSAMALSTGHKIDPETCIKVAKELTWKNTAEKINDLQK